MWSYLGWLWGNRRRLPARRKPRCRPRLGLEALEGREVPAFMVAGDHLFVIADAATDTFGLTAVQGGKPQVTLNNTSYTGDMSGIDKISFQGVGGGQNKAVLTDTTNYGFLNLNLTGGAGTLHGASYALDLSNMASITATADIGETATLTGLAQGQNTYVGTSTDSTLSNSTCAQPFVDRVIGFGFVYAHSATAADTAYLHGSTSSVNDYTLMPTVSQSGGMRQIGQNSYPWMDEADGFGHVYAYAGTSSDTANLLGSKTSPNTYVGTPTWSYLSSSASFNEALGFSQAVAFGGTQSDGTVDGTSSDVAYLYGSTSSQNTYCDTPMHFASWMSNTTYYKEQGFGHVYAYAGTSADLAYFLGRPTSQNTFTGTPTYAWMSSSGHFAEGFGFGHVFAYNGTSSDVAYLYGSTTSQNTYVGRPTDSTLSSATSLNEAQGFAQVFAYAGTANDVAYLYGSTTSPNTFYGTPTYSSMSSSTSFNDAVGFHQVLAYAGTASDVAHLFGSSHLQQTVDSYVWGNNYWVDARSFNTVVFNM